MGRDETERKTRHLPATTGGGHGERHETRPWADHRPRWPWRAQWEGTSSAIAIARETNSSHAVMTRTKAKRTRFQTLTPRSSAAPLIHPSPSAAPGVSARPACLRRSARAPPRMRFIGRCGGSMQVGRWAASTWRMP